MTFRRRSRPDLALDRFRQTASEVPRRAAQRHSSGTKDGGMGSRVIMARARNGTRHMRGLDMGAYTTSTTGRTEGAYYTTLGNGRGCCRIYYATCTRNNAAKAILNILDLPRFVGFVFSDSHFVLYCERALEA
jgi:hypothetical protein